jgi:transcriptional regulator
MLVLKVLQGGPQHGYGIAVRLQQLSSDVLQVEEGSLYPALYRMERKGWVEAEWGTSELGRRVKLYRLTRPGRQQLASDTAAWQAFSTAVTRVLVKV